MSRNRSLGDRKKSLKMIQVWSLPLNNSLQELRDLLEVRHLSTFDLLSLTAPLIRKREQILETFLGRCLIVISFFTTAIAYLSLAFIVSVSHINSSPTTAIQISM